VHSAAFRLHEQGKDPEAIKLISAFQVRLASVRVLDPACGSGNFLYVTLEHLKRLEGEVLDTLESLGERQLLMAMEGVSVDPHQLLGLELNPRAAAIAETVLWIGYLQWHFRTHGNVNPPEPVIRDFRNIQCRDAVLAYDRVEWVTDESGRPVTRWDGRTYKPHPVTGELVPDESAQVPLERYVNPRRAAWPEADFVVGNPPFIGAGGMRRALGDGYVDALRGAWREVPESADFVMYWWERAAELARAGRIRRFGFITTNSLRQTFNRRVLERHLQAAEPLSLLFAIPDHPWVDAAGGAAVRIGMTVAEAGESPGVIDQVVAERVGQGEGLDVDLERTTGRIHADLRIGADLASALPLRANQGISARGVSLHGAGFIVTPAEAAALGLGRLPGLERHIRRYLNGRDLTQSPRGVMVIDLFGLTADEVRTHYPEVYQWVLERVKPERDQNNRATYRDNWWIFGEPRKDLRPALTGLTRYIATVETAKHRTFVFLDQSILPDNKLINIALDEAWTLGVLSSRVHVLWALASGSHLGVGNDPVYVKTRCFETFPFPDPAEPLKAHIRQLAEDLDAHRKQRQALHPGLTMTGMYNVLEQLRRGGPLSPKDRQVHEQGLVSVLRQLHDELDAAVLVAYGWEDLTAALVATPVGAASRRAGPGAATGAEDPAGTTLAPTEPGAALDQAAAVEETLLQRLVALNAERAAEERRGLSRWLRPDFQHPGGGATLQAEATMTATTPAASGPKLDWPKTLPEQFQALRAALAARPGPLNAANLAQGFTRAPRARVAELLDTLATLGHIRRLPDGRYLPG
ncbi:MAG: class I SAM-dependent DNA methyltransferase, partial [Chromatiaceae bacterium]|nr:class I SAM-dependent DNA methyltransferase [Chromatiaceae bacterium]